VEHSVNSALFNLTVEQEPIRKNVSVSRCDVLIHTNIVEINLSLQLSMLVELKRVQVAFRINCFGD
jgi:hypothetical protein